MLTPPTVSVYPAWAGTATLNSVRSAYPSAEYLGEILHNKITVQSTDESWTAIRADCVRHRRVTNREGEVTSDETWTESVSCKGVSPSTEWIWDTHYDYDWMFPPNSEFIDWAGSGSINRGTLTNETVSVTVYMERCCVIRIQANGSTGGDGFIGDSHYKVFTDFAEAAGNPFKSAYLYRKSNDGFLPVGWFDSNGNKICGIRRGGILPPITWEVGSHEYSYLAKFMPASHMPLCTDDGNLVYVDYNGAIVGHF